VAANSRPIFESVVNELERLAYDFTLKYTLWEDMQKSHNLNDWKLVGKFFFLLLASVSQRW